METGRVELPSESSSARSLYRFIRLAAAGLSDVCHDYYQTSQPSSSMYNTGYQPYERELTDALRPKPERYLC